jgi:hypothetical protein
MAAAGLLTSREALSQLLEAPGDPTCDVMVIPNCGALVLQCREGARSIISIYYLT